MTDILPVPRVTLGQAVTFTHYQARRHGSSDRHYHYRKEWRTTPVSRLTPDQDTITGVLIGTRTLSNGTCSFGEDGTNYIPDRDGHFTAWLVAYDLRRNPVLVLPEHTTQEPQ